MQNQKDEMLQISVPAKTKKNLKVMAAQTGVPMRAIVLKALAKYGIEVPQGATEDRRVQK